ncbi:MAG TPA: flagellar FliJ family protein, partial [Spirochaetales bacterium]|nr:flagellar FliJ family protein [Spirochaetales bacterium]
REVREYALEAAKAQLAQAAGACAILDLQLKENASLSLEASRNRFRAGGNASDFRSSERYVLRLTQDRDRLLKALALAEAKREEARLEYVRASQAHELIQKLKERAQREYYHHALQEETKVLDDIAAGTAARLANT